MPTKKHFKRMYPDINLDALSEEKLLDLRLCELPLSIQGTWLEPCIQKLYLELEQKGIVHFRPSCYLADEWLTPDEEPIIGIPFYLAHPVLMKLEEKMMLEIEGGTKDWCMKLLRHETGHAINYAYRLYRRKKWKQIFGSFLSDYPETYRYKPYSKNFVHHLDSFYAQYHPDEDFTETFAVWLTPESDWMNRYKGWKALKKLQYVDDLMRGIKNKKPIVSIGKKYWDISTLRRTLKNHYQKRRRFWTEDFPDFHDDNLRRIFQERNKENKDCPLVWSVIKRYRKGMLKDISLWTGEKKHVINDQLKKITQRCRALKLVASPNEQEAMVRLAVYLTTLIGNYKYTGWFRGKK